MIKYLKILIHFTESSDADPIPNFSKKKNSSRISLNRRLKPTIKSFQFLEIVMHYLFSFVIGLLALLLAGPGRAVSDSEAIKIVGGQVSAPYCEVYSGWYWHSHCTGPSGCELQEMEQYDWAWNYPEDAIVGTVLLCPGITVGGVSCSGSAQHEELVYTCIGND